MHKLVSGVRRFHDEVYTPRRHAYDDLLDGQSPRALFITCSDSRLDPEALTQAGPGDMFVLRNAGNLIPPFGAGHGGEAASVEYAVAGLKVPNVIVCGHTHCGAVRAILQPETLADLPETARWLQHAEATRRIARTRFARYDFAERWALTVEQNVLVQLENLCTHPSVAAGLATGTLNLYGWVFDLAHGTVRNFDPARGAFVELPHAAEDAASLPTAIARPLALARPGADGLRLARP